MVAFPIEVWAVMGVIAGATLLAIFASAARARRQECTLHDLKCRVHELRTAYHRRLADLRREVDDEPVLEVEPIEVLERLAA